MKKAQLSFEMGFFLCCEMLEGAFGISDAFFIHPSSFLIHPSSLHYGAGVAVAFADSACAVFWAFTESVAAVMKFGSVGT